MNTAIVVSIISSIIGPILVLLITGLNNRRKEMNNLDKKLDTVLDKIEDLNNKVLRLNSGFDVLAKASDSVFESLHNKQIINGETKDARESLKDWMLENGSLRKNN